MTIKTQKHTVTLRPNYTTLSLEEKADELGDLRAALKPLLEAQASLETDLKKSGREEVNGDRYRVTISVFDRATVAWKKIAEKLGASKQMIVGNTSNVTVTKLNVTALPKN